MSNVYNEFVERDLIAQATDEEAIAKLLETEQVTFYIGFARPPIRFMSVISCR